MFSIRRYLLVTLLLVAGGSMALTGWWSYRAAVEEVEELFDAQLAQSARVLVATLASRPLLFDRDGEADDTVVFPAWHERDPEDEDHGHEVTAMDAAGRLVVAGHKYETRLAFQLWEGAGERLLMRSSNAPLEPVAAFGPGYAETLIGGEHFHVFSVAHEGLWLQVAQDDYMRNELAMKIALAALVPHLASLPLMALLTWLLVARGLRPLDELRAAIAGRDAGNLLPVDTGPSVELQPVVSELNGLLARLGASFERERRFTADAAHELRTPLAVLRIHAENALAATDDAGRREALEKLLRGVDRASRLVEQMLTLARVEPDDALRRFETLRFNALVREELAALVPIASRRGQDIDFDDAAAFEVRGDRALLGILVRNLVDNALRYSPDESLVRVVLRGAEGGGLELTVLDEGPGVPAELAGRVFERFFRGDSGRGDGAGLGLAIVSRIVDLHAGRVTVLPRRDEVAGGFRVWLPATPATRASRAAAPA